MAFAIPAEGDFEGQAQAGANLIEQIESGDTAGLLEAGISAIGGPLGSSPGGAMLMDAVGGALSGFAMYGPVGAALGGALGALEGAAGSFFGPADTVIDIYGVSQATQTITGDVQALGAKAPNPLNNHPAGWAMADYLAFARPPSSSKNVDGFSQTASSVQAYAISQMGGVSAGELLASVEGSGFIAGSLQSQVPLCTPVWFEWFTYSSIVDCYQDLLFGSGGAGGDPNALYNAWVQSTLATGSLSQAEIVKRAAAVAPDPFYFSASLYGATFSSGAFGAGYATVYWNPDLLNAMATVMAMRSCGASTQAILSELLIQAAILQKTGGLAPGGGSMPGDIALNQYGFRRLLDDYIRLANAQNAAAGISSASAISTGGMAGSVALGATGALLAGVLGYSLYTRRSPVDVTRAALARTKLALRRF
jgi:hypothetical protein